MVRTLPFHGNNMGSNPIECKKNLIFKMLLSDYTAYIINFSTFLILTTLVIWFIFLTLNLLFQNIFYFLYKKYIFIFTNLNLFAPYLFNVSLSKDLAKNNPSFKLFVPAEVPAKDIKLKQGPRISNTQQADPFSVIPASFNEGGSVTNLERQMEEELGLYPRSKYIFSPVQDSANLLDKEIAEAEAFRKFKELLSVSKKKS